MGLQVWKLKDGETHWVIAGSEEDAKHLLLENMRGCGLEAGDYDLDSILSCEALPPDEVLVINEDEGPVACPAHEWVAQGRGYLCGTCW